MQLTNGHPQISLPSTDGGATDYSNNAQYVDGFEKLFQELDAETLSLCEPTSYVFAEADGSRMETAAAGSPGICSHAYEPSNVLSTASSSQTSSALSLDSQIEVVDEPESGLDPGSDARLLNIQDQQPEVGRHKMSELVLGTGVGRDSNSPAFASTSTLRVQIHSDHVKTCSCVPPCLASRPYLSPWCTEGLEIRLKARLSYLQALDLPGDEMIKLLIECYFSYVHPLFPVISERDTYLLFHPTEVTDTQQPLPMSLAKFNAIMSAACSV
jgi:hypothetical protein